MDTLPGRASKAVNVLFGNKQRKKTTNARNEMPDMSRRDNIRSALIEAGMYNCNYCSKIFAHPKYVMKHMLRKHSENLLKLHNQVVDGREMEQNLLIDRNGPKIPTNDLSEKVNDLRELLQTLRFEVNQQLKAAKRTNDSSPFSSSDFAQPHCKPNRQKRHSRQEEPKTNCTKELIELKTKSKNVENLIQNLDVKYKNVLEAINQNACLKDNIIQNANNNQKVLRELKVSRSEIHVLKDSLENQISAAQISLSKEIEQQKKHLEEHVYTLERKYALEIEKLDTELKSCISKLEANENVDMQTIIDQQLQCYLEQLPCKPNDSRPRKQELVSLPCKPTRSSKGKKLTPRTAKKVTAEIKMGFPRISSFGTNIREELSYHVDTKLQKLGISLIDRRISTAELKSKGKIIKHEMKMLQAKYGDFRMVRKKLEKCADLEVQRLLTEGVPKRHITFATCNDAKSPFSKNANPMKVLKVEQVISSKKVNVRESSEFVTPRECQLSLDRMPKTANVSANCQMEKEGNISEDNCDSDEASEISLTDHTTDSVIDIDQNTLMKSAIPTVERGNDSNTECERTRPFSPSRLKLQCSKQTECHAKSSLFPPSMGKLTKIDRRLSNSPAIAVQNSDSESTSSSLRTPRGWQSSKQTDPCVKSLFPPNKEKLTGMDGHTFSSIPSAALKNCEPASANSSLGSPMSKSSLDSWDDFDSNDGMQKF